MSISRYMCDAFEARYGHRFLPFHNVQDTAAWPVPPRSDWTPPDPCVLVYAGRVGKANEKALRDIAVVVAGLAKSGVRVRLDIYALERAPFAAGTWPDSEAVRVLPAVAYDQIAHLAGDRGRARPAARLCRQGPCVCAVLDADQGGGVPQLRDADPRVLPRGHRRHPVRPSGPLGGGRRHQGCRCPGQGHRPPCHRRRRARTSGRTALEVARVEEDPVRVRAAFARALREAADRRDPATGEVCDESPVPRQRSRQRRPGASALAACHPSSSSLGAARVGHGRRPVRACLCATPASR